MGNVPDQPCQPFQRASAWSYPHACHGAGPEGGWRKREEGGLEEEVWRGLGEVWRGLEEEVWRGLEEEVWRGLEEEEEVEGRTRARTHGRTHGINRF